MAWSARNEYRPGEGASLMVICDSKNGTVSSSHVILKLLCDFVQKSCGEIGILLLTAIFIDFHRMQMYPKEIIKSSIVFVSLSATFCYVLAFRDAHR